MVYSGCPGIGPNLLPCPVQSPRVVDPFHHSNNFHFTSSVTLCRLGWPGMVGIGAGPGQLRTSPDVRFGARVELAAPIGFLGPVSIH